MCSKSCWTPTSFLFRAETIFLLLAGCCWFLAGPQPSPPQQLPLAKGSCLAQGHDSLLGTACLQGHKGPGLMITQSGTWPFQSSLKGWLRTVQLLLLPKPASLTPNRYCSRENCPSSKKIRQNPAYEYVPQSPFPGELKLRQLEIRSQE